MVVITGDVVHDKLDISNEQIEFLARFLKGVSAQFPCLVTLGNHDCVVGTPSRLNSLKWVKFKDDALRFFLTAYKVL